MLLGDGDMYIILDINNSDRIKEITKIIKNHYNNKVKVLDYGSFFFSCIIKTQKKRYELTKLNDDYTVNTSYYDKLLEEYANKKIESIKGDDILVVYNSNRLFCLEKSRLYDKFNLIVSDNNGLRLKKV